MKKLVLVLISLVLLLSMTGCEFKIVFNTPEYGFAREVPEAEKALRRQVIKTAVAWVGCKESDTFFSNVARDAARLMVVVVFPTPPF